MEKKSKEDFRAWAEKNDWLLLNELGTHDGWQDTFLAPSGTTLFILYDLKGYLDKVMYPVPPPAPQPAQPRTQFLHPLK